MRLVITIPDIPSDPAKAVEKLDASIYLDTYRVVQAIAAELGPELRPGTHGWVNGTAEQGVRLHWVIQEG